MQVLVENWPWMVALVVIGGGYVALMRAYNSRAANLQPSGRLVSRGSLRLWRALVAAGGDDWLVLPEVPLKRLIKLASRKPPEDDKRKLEKWTLDFVMLDPFDGESLVAVKLIEASDDEVESASKSGKASSTNSQEKELAELRALLSVVKLPLLAVPSAKRYQVKSLREQLDKLIDADRAKAKAS